MKHINAPFELNKTDVDYLRGFTKTGKHSSHEIKHAYVLMALHKGKINEDIMDYYDVGRATIWRIKKRYLQHGLQDALASEVRIGQPKKYEQKDVEELIRLAVSTPPKGRKRWTLKLLKECVPKSNAFNSINRETIRLILKNENVKFYDV